MARRDTRSRVTSSCPRPPPCSCSYLGKKNCTYRSFRCKNGENRSTGSKDIEAKRYNSIQSVDTYEYSWTLNEHFSCWKVLISTTFCGLGYNCTRMKLAYFVDQLVMFQIIFFNFLDPLRGQRIVPERTKSLRNNNIKKNGKKKVWEIDWNAPKKKFESDPTKKIFMRVKPYAVRKQKFTNKVCELINRL